MKITKIALLALAVFTPFSNAASLNLPYSVDLLALNGKEQGDKAALETLSQGKQQVVIRYSKTLKDGSKRALYTSKPFVFEFDVKNASEDYKLSHKKFRNYKAAEAAFNANKIGWKIEHNGQVEPVQPEVLLAEGFMPYSDIEKAIRYHNKEKGIVLTSAGAMNVTEAAVTVSESGKVEVTGDAVTQLKLWYSKASKAERKEFKKWMIDQD